MMRISTILEITVGILTVITGLLYVFQVFGQTESEVVMWGFLAVVLGSLIPLSGTGKNKIAGLLEGFLVFFLILIQIPAIMLWFSFSGSGISDGTPQSNFVAHWIYALPHMVIVLLGIALIVSVFKQKSA